MSSINNFDPSQWLANHTSVGSYDIETLGPAMWYALIWNRFELEICDREAYWGNIQKSVLCAYDSQRIQWSDFEDIWIALVAYLSRNGHLCDLHSFLLSGKKVNSKEQDYVDTTLLPTIQSDHPDVTPALEGMLFIAYRVRNNLFHGEKCITSLARQRELFTILNCLLARYINTTTIPATK